MTRMNASVLVAALVTSSTMAAPLEIGSRLVPIVDDWAIASMKNTALKLHSPQNSEVVFVFDAEWELGQSGYVTILRDGEKFRMYYRGGGDLGREYSCVAESTDGRQWTRPNLGLLELKKSKNNNAFWTGRDKSYYESHNFSPFVDTNPEAKPEERYKAVTGSKTGDRGGDRKKVLVAFASPDGIHWKRMRDEPIITDGAFDSHNVAFWDSVRKEYVCFFRRPQQGKRSVARATSKDFLNWTKPEMLDFTGSPLEQFYTNGIVPYFRAPDVYIGLPMRFVPPQERNTVGLPPRKTDGLSDAVFMSSHDGLHWHRPFMEAFIRPGLDPKNWGGAHGNTTPAFGFVQTGPTEMSIYWSEHCDNYPANNIIPQLRRGVMRLDGFVSVNAGYAAGEFVTKPLVFAGRTLLLNVSTSAVGSVRVEIQGADGKPVPGFALEECPEIWGDEIERVVAWKGGTDVGSLAGKTVRLRFAMKDADLYAIRVKPE